MYKGKKYNIFICYRGDDSSFGGRLYDKLNLKNEGLVPFYAKEVVDSGDNFVEAILGALEDVKVFIMLLTPKFFDKCGEKDDIVQLEIETALNDDCMQFIPIWLRDFDKKAQEAFSNASQWFPANFTDKIAHNNAFERHDIGKLNDIADELIKKIKKAIAKYDKMKKAKQSIALWQTPATGQSAGNAAGQGQSRQSNRAPQPQRAVQQSSAAGQSYSNDDQESPCICYAHSYAHSEWSYRGSKSEFGKKAKAALSPVVDFAKEWGLKAVLPAVLALIALITLLVCFCGMRGIYVNVDDPNEFYSFNATRYEYHGTLLGEDYVEKGTWKVDDGQLKLTHKGADGERVTESYYFDARDSKKRISISSEFGVNKEFKRVSLLAYSIPQKIKITFDGNGGSQGAYIPVGSGMEPFAGGTQKVDIGSKLKELADPVRDGYLFMGWYTMPNGWKTGMGEQFFFEDRVWEKATYYANWKDSSVFTLTGDGLDEPVKFTEGDDILAAYMQAMGWDSLPSGATGLIFRAPNGNKIVATCAPAANVSVTVIIGYLIENGVLKDVSPELNEFVIPSNVTSIGSTAFRGCDSLTSVTIPDSVTSIGSYAFHDCDALTSVAIGDSVTSIGNNAFYNCGSLTSVTFEGTMAEWEAVEKGRAWNDYCPLTEVKCSDGSVSV